MPVEARGLVRLRQTFAAGRHALQPGTPCQRWNRAQRAHFTRRRGFLAACVGVPTTLHILPEPLLSCHSGPITCAPPPSLCRRGFLATCVGVLTLHILADAKDHPGRLLATKFGRFRDFGGC